MRVWLPPVLASCIGALLLLPVSVEAQFAQQGLKLVGTGATGNAKQGHNVAVSADGNTAIVGALGDNGFFGAAWVFTRSGSVWTQQGAKLIGTGGIGTTVQQGMSVAISADGNTAIVGGLGDNSNVGAAWVFTRSGGVWTQQGAKLVGSGSVGNSQQGYSVSLSADGNTAIVGGSADALSGAAWVWTRSGGVWTQQGAKLVGTGAVGNANQGYAVALSGDGNTAMVGGYNDDSLIGAAWVFTRSGGVWSQQGTKLVGTGRVGISGQGRSVALSSDGSTAMVGGNNDNTNAGAAWVWTRSGGVWTQQGAKLVGTGAQGTLSEQGIDVSLSSDGNKAIVGGYADNNLAGATWVWTRSGSVWTQQGAKLVGTGATGNAQQGLAVSLSADGNTAVIGGEADNGDAGATWVFVVPATAPGAPTGVMGTAGNMQVALSWTAPAGNGGSAITGYQVQVATSSGGTYTNAAGCPTNSTTTACTATGLTNGTQYFFKVAAINAVGTGDYSSASSGITPATVPDAPTGVTGTGGNAQVALLWTAPASNGGSAITGYRVQVATSSGGSYSDAAGCPTNSTATSCTATGLSNGTPYFFKVAAINAAGTGAYSSASSGVTPMTVPGVTTGVTGAAGNAQVALSWTAPASNGGSAITGYQVQVATSSGGTYTNAAGCPTNLTTTACTATGLTNGTQYFFKVAAINAAGTGVFSTTSSGVTPGSFTDTPLVAGVTPIKGVHITELRSRINALRALHPPLGPYPFTDTITSATNIKAQHILELRQALLEVYQQIAQTPPTYATTPVPGGPIVVADVESLRSAVLAIE
jgi:hypothetical protein